MLQSSVGNLQINSVGKNQKVKSHVWNKALLTLLRLVLTWAKELLSNATVKTLWL